LFTHATFTFRLKYLYTVLVAPIRIYLTLMYMDPLSWLNFANKPVLEDNPPIEKDSLGDRLCYARV